MRSREMFIPMRLDWLVVPDQNVEGVTYAYAIAIIERKLKNKQSPLVWMRDKDGELQKCFIVFW